MTIELKQSELAMQGLTIPDFYQLQLAEKRWVASRILRTHGNDNDDFAADMIDLAHPNFSQFTILVGQ